MVCGVWCEASTGESPHFPTTLALQPWLCNRGFATGVTTLLAAVRFRPLLDPGSTLSGAGGTTRSAVALALALLLHVPIGGASRSYLARLAQALARAAVSTFEEGDDGEHTQQRPQARRAFFHPERSRKAAASLKTSASLGRG